MDFFTALLNTYDKALEKGLVGTNEEGRLNILPLYHQSTISNGNNIIEVRLDKNGKIVAASFLEKGQRIIYPVTLESFDRSASMPPSHVLTDKLKYYLIKEDVNKKDSKQQPLSIHPQLREWIEETPHEQVKAYLQVIYEAIDQENLYDTLLKQLYGSDNKQKIKEDTLLTFVVENFIEDKDYSITSYSELHNEHIRHIRKKIMLDENGVSTKCNISGEQKLIAAKHRGVLAKAKIISASNHIEAYKGRFKGRDDIVKVGQETSEKVHLMLKAFQENRNTYTYLEADQLLLNWFDDDIANESHLSFINEDKEFLLYDESEESTKIITVATIENRKLGESFLQGKRLFNDASNYYAAIINKVGKGRVALKYFRQLKGSELLNNLGEWQKCYSWEVVKQNRHEAVTPSFKKIIRIAFGHEQKLSKKGKEVYEVVLENDELQNKLLQGLVTALLDGKRMDMSIQKRMEQNIRQRHRYKNTWNQVEFVALALLNDYRGKKMTPMLERENQDRSYLFGRLLAIFELLEEQCYKLEAGIEGRVTNAERYWHAYTTQPASIMETLFSRIKSYANTLKYSEKRGIYTKLEKEQEEIITLLSQHKDKSNFNKPLDYQFIFGYYAEKKFYYSKQAETK